MKLIQINPFQAVFLCLLKMPFGFYKLVRMIALVGFAILSYKVFEESSSNEGIIYIGLAILFQPVLEFALGKGIVGKMLKT